MANVQQAAIWLERGHAVKRHIWGSDTWIRFVREDLEIKVFPETNRSHVFVFSLVDLLANDWEIAY